MRELKVNKKNTSYTTFRGKIAKFSYLPFKEIVLLLNVEYYDLMDGKWKHFREHIWVDNFLPTKKNVQGKNISFSGSIYEYKNSKGRTNKGIAPDSNLLVFHDKNIHKIQSI